MLLPVQEHLLIRLDGRHSGFKGVRLTNEGSGRYQAQCDTPPCLHSYLGTFDTPQDAAQEKNKHLEELEKQRAPQPPPPVLPEVQHHLLIRSDKNKTGYKGVHADRGRYMATCTTATCRNNYLGSFGTPEDAAQAYLQHWMTGLHPEELIEIYPASLTSKLHTACDCCRAVKIKCDGKAPCSRCDHRHLNCSYSLQHKAAPHRDLRTLL